MNRIALLFVGFLIVVTSGYADEGASPQKNESFGNIRRGNLAVGGSMNFSSYSPSRGDGYSTLALAAVGQYFIFDRLSFGPSLSYTRSDGAGIVTPGVGATYHIISMGNVVPFVGAGFGVGLNATTHTSTYGSATNPQVSVQKGNLLNVNAQVGVNYFFTPSVALGPSIRVNIDQDGYNSSSVTTTSFLIGFSVFL